MACRSLSVTHLAGLLQTVMFTLYGNQYEDREEQLLLNMFEVHHGGVAGLRYTMGVWLVYSIVLLYILPSPPPLSSVL